MKTESYTPGHTANAADFMAKRTLASHGAFFRDHLSPGLRVLDCGCGPGSITLGIAEAVFPGKVMGIDAGESQIARARKCAHEQGAAHVDFITSGCYALPCVDSSFDCVFSHALLEHLAEPQKALAEFCRVLRPGGSIGLCSPDWGGFILAPPSPELSAAIAEYTALQTKNGGDVFVGRKLGTYLEQAGFSSICMQARYECYPSLSFISEYLAVQLKEAGKETHADTLRAWSKNEGGLFAQAWISAVGTKS